MACGSWSPQKIKLSFMSAGHTRCLAVDGCFGLVKRAYCQADIFTLGQLSDVVNSSAACNVSELESAVTWYAWISFFAAQFHRVKSVLKLHHFVFSSEMPGVVFTQQSIGKDPSEVATLKVPQVGLSTATMPAALPRGSLTLDRQTYLF